MTKNYSIAGVTAILGVIVHTVTWSIIFGSGEGLDWKEMATSKEMNPTLEVFWLLGAAASMFLLLALKRLLNERHAYGSVDPFIWASVIWHGIFFGGSLVLELIPATNDFGILAIFHVVGFVVFGAIDIIIAIKLLRADRKFPSLIKTIAVVNLIIGICEVSVILAFLLIPLVAVWFVLFAILFFSKPKEIEFV